MTGGGGSTRPPYVAVIGPAEATPAEETLAADVGELLARRGAVVVCGGHGGVMAAVCRGATAAGGMTVGILPGAEHDSGNGFLTIEIPTGIGQARNALVVGCAEAIIVVGNSWGTFSEIGLAMRAGKPVFQLAGDWGLSPPAGAAVPGRAESAGQAVSEALAAIASPGQAR